MHFLGNLTHTCVLDVHEAKLDHLQVSAMRCAVVEQTVQIIYISKDNNGIILYSLQNNTLLQVKIRKKNYLEVRYRRITNKCIELIKG